MELFTFPYKQEPKNHNKKKSEKKYNLKDVLDKKRSLCKTICALSVTTGDKAVIRHRE